LLLGIKHKIRSRKRQHKKSIIAKQQSHKPTTLHVAGIFNLLFLGKNFETILIMVEKV
jgi:hypothetical protein